jgi:hypothetical protein
MDDTDEAEFLFEILSERKDLPVDYFDNNLSGKTKILNMLHQKTELLKRCDDNDFDDSENKIINSRNDDIKEDIKEDDKSVIVIEHKNKFDIKVRMSIGGIILCSIVLIICFFIKK